MVEVFIKPYHEWLAKTPPHCAFLRDIDFFLCQMLLMTILIVHIGSVGLHAVNPIWEAQSKVLYMMYGFFGVCICAISTQGTETPFVDEGKHLLCATCNTSLLTGATTAGFHQF